MAAAKKQFLTERIMISITPDELKRVEAHALRMAADTGLPVSQSAATRALLLTALRGAENGGTDSVLLQQARHLNAKTAPRATRVRK